MWCRCDFSISSQCDVYLASYSRRVLDVWSDHFRHIVCVLCELLLALLIYNIQRENHPQWDELYFHFSIFLLVRESERGNLHYDSVAISRDLLAQSDLVTVSMHYVWTPSTGQLRRGRRRLLFLQQKCFCGVEKENWPPLWVLYV